MTGVIYTENVTGNVHETASWINAQRADAADFLVQIAHVSDGRSIAVFRLPLGHRLLVEREERRARQAKEAS